MATSSPSTTSMFTPSRPAVPGCRWCTICVMPSSSIMRAKSRSFYPLTANEVDMLREAASDGCVFWHAPCFPSPIIQTKPTRHDPIHSSLERMLLLAAFASCSLAPAPLPWQRLPPPTKLP